MIAAIDVHYKEDGSALAGAVVFADFSDSEAHTQYALEIPGVAPYKPGQFYRRELPCIMAILGLIEDEIDTVIIDGYVDLGDKPGLGRYLWNTLNHKKKIIGVAKRHFRGSDATRVFRGKSRNPLYITAAGLKQRIAADLISGMQGKHRLPQLIRQADNISRKSRSGSMDP